MKGTGEYAETIERMMQVTAARHGLRYGPLSNEVPDPSVLHATGAPGLKQAATQAAANTRPMVERTGQLKLF
jgi:hypothetical protein